MLFVLVPYRATNQPQRVEELQRFLQVMPALLPDARLVVVQQVDTRKFNRGLLFNACVNELALTDDDTLCLHDVDLIPEGVLLDEYTRALRPHTARHIGHAAIAGLQRYSTFKPRAHCFGGVSLIRVSDFVRVNGFPNDFWGWGGEDTVLGMRVCRCPHPAIAIERSVGVLRDSENIQSHSAKMQQLCVTTSMGKGIHAMVRKYKKGALFANGLAQAKYKVAACNTHGAVWHFRIDCT